MFNIIDLEYINKVAPQLHGFKKSNKKFNFRCPYCGDSAKSEKKQRGWFIDFNGETFYKCFNCGISKNFAHFLKENDIGLYNQYIFDKFNDTRYIQNAENKKDNSIYVTKEQLDKCPYMKSCKYISEGQFYLRQRKITKLDKFYYTEKYGKILEYLNLKDYEAEWNNENKAIVIPHYTRDNKVAFLQFRFLVGKLRYRTYRLIENAPKIWGIEDLDLNKPIIITEGAFDASLLNNAVAMSGADLNDNWLINNYKQNIHFIMDNEPYNVEILKRYDKIAENGFNLFIWPEDVKEKDINEYYLAHNNVDLFHDESHYFKDMFAEWELSKWRKMTK